jgi:hypothetical protein
MTVYIGVDFHARQQRKGNFMGSGLRFVRFSINAVIEPPDAIREFT